MKSGERMFRTYTKTIFRNLNLNKTQTLIKIIGLTFALTVSIAIFTWVKHELSYDNFHNDSDQIYRLVLEDSDGATVTSPPGMKKIFDQFHEIKYSVRLFKSDFLGEKQKVECQNKVFTNDRIYYADDDFFKIFSFPLLQGNPANVLKKTNAAVITETTARKYFGNENPVGKTLLLADKNELEVTGILKDIPSNSHFHFDILIPLKGHEWWSGIDNGINLGSMWIFPTYVKISRQTDINYIQKMISKELDKFQYKPKKIFFQPLKDIHLHSSYLKELEANGDIKYIYLFASVGLLIIVMSSVNYINLTSALSKRRIKEIGIRKYLGASKYQLISQFTGESIFISLVSFISSLFLLELFSSMYFAITGNKLFFGIYNDPVILVYAFLFTLFVGTITGLFPAIILAKQNTTNSLKSLIQSTENKRRSRGILIVFQFCISVALIICSLVIYRQMMYIQNKKLGYNKEQILVLNLGRDQVIKKIDVLKKSISGNPNVIGITISSQLPTDIKTPERINTSERATYESYYISVDKEFFKTMGIHVVKGNEQIKNLMINNNLDWKNYENRFVVNRALLNEIGTKLEDSDNQSLTIRHGNMIPGRIIGVVDDFHFKSLHEPIRPLVFEFTPVESWQNTYMLVKIGTGNVSETINYIKGQWVEIARDLPYEYYFLDDEYDALYAKESQTGKLFMVFTIVSIFIIVLGLLGLISYVVNQKTKEIGIRKVLGASIFNVLLILIKDFIKWVVISNIVAWPLAYFLMNKWLQDFAYRIEISWWIFVLSGGIALLIAIITISFQAIKAAAANPVDSLKYE